MTRYRGAMIAPKTPIERVLDLKAAGANVCRAQMTMPYAESYTPEDYIKELGTFIPFLKSYAQTGIDVVADLHTPPGGYTEEPKKMVLFQDAKYAACVVNAWKLLGEQLASEERIKFFDLLNEPLGNIQQVDFLLHELAHGILKQNPAKRPIVSSRGADPSKWAKMSKLGQHVWLTSHLYWPMAFTHQGLYGYPVGVKYPNAKANKNRMKAHLQELRAFQLLHGNRVFIGEFGCSKFADSDSRVRWLEDVISILEEWRWSGCYHAWFGESDVWVPEDPNILGVLYSWWSENSIDA